MTEITVPAYLNPYTGKLQDSPNFLPANADGQIWTVTGSGFGTKSRQSPVIWDQFTGGTEGELLSDYDADYIPYQNVGSKITTRNPRYTGCVSAGTSYKKTGSGFPISYKAFTASRKVFVSYWYRVSDWIVGKDGGVCKLNRLNSLAGGGRYSSVTGVDMGGGSPPSNGFAGLTVAADAPNDYHTTGYVFPYATNTWLRVEHELYLSDVDTANGYLKTLVSETVFENLTGQITNSTTKNYLSDTFLLAMEQANASQFYYVNSVLDNTVYSVVYLGVTHNYNSGAGATANSIVNGLADVVRNYAGNSAGDMIVYGDEIAAWGGNGGTFDAKFTITPNEPFLHCTDIYLDTDSIGRFVIGNAATYSACTIREPQPYLQWSDTLVKFTVHAPTITGTKYLYFIDDAGTTTLKGIMNEDGSLA